MAFKKPDQQNTSLNKRLSVLLLVWFSLSVTVWMVGEDVARQFIPLYHWTVKMLGSQYQLNTLRIEQQGGEMIFRAKVFTANSRQLGAYTIPDGQALSSSTLLAHTLQSFIVFYLVLLVWPLPGWLHRFGLIVLSVPVLLLIEMLDVPFVLYGALEDLMLANFDPGALKFSMSVQWMNFMNSGGRLALSLIGGFVTINLWRWVVMQNGHKMMTYFRETFNLPL